jgi:hypothetical protein
MTTVQYVVATGFSLAVVFFLVNFVVFVYARGAVRAAVDEGARSGSRADAGVAECVERSRDVVDDLVGGALGDGVRVTCEQPDPDTVVAYADVVLQSWLPGVVPDWTFELEARSVKEHAP